MFKSIATWALLAAAVVKAAPTPVGSFDFELDARSIEPRAVRNGFANFERLNTSGLAINEIGYYGGLSWQGIGAVSAGSAGGLLAGIKPQSPTNVAAYGAVTKVLSNSPNITSQYAGSKTSSFSIKSFYFGCLEAVVALPVGCKVAMAGYDASNNLLAYQASYFNPVNKTVNAMQFMKLNSNFTGLTYVKLATNYVGLNIVGSTVLDDVTYTITTTS